MSDAGRIVAGGAAVRLTANLDEVRAALAALPRMMADAGAKSVRGIGPSLKTIQKQIEETVAAAAKAASGLGDPLAKFYGTRAAAGRATMMAGVETPALAGAWEPQQAGAARIASEIAAAYAQLSAGSAEGLKEQTSAAAASGVALKAYRKDVQAAAAANAAFRSSMMSVGMAGAMLAAIGGSVVYALLRWSRQAAASSLELLNLAGKTGLTTTQFQGLQHAAQMAGASSEELETGIKRMNLVVKQAGDGGREANAALADLGLTFNDLKDKDVYDRLLAVSDGLAKVKDGGLRAGMAVQIFGRTGANMLPVLEGGAQHLRELAATAERYGIIIDEKVIRANAQLARQYAILGKQWDAAKMQLGGALGPMLIDVAQAAGNAATAFARFAAAHPIFIRLVAILGAVALAVGTVAAGVATATWAITTLVAAAAKIVLLVGALKAVAVAGAIASAGLAPLLITIGLIVAAAVAAAAVLDALYAKKTGPERSDAETRQGLENAEERLRVVREVRQVEMDSAHEIARIKAGLIEDEYERERTLIYADAEHKIAALRGVGMAAELIIAKTAAIQAESSEKLAALDEQRTRKRLREWGKLQADLAAAQRKELSSLDEFAGKWAELRADQARRRAELGPGNLGTFDRLAAQEQYNLAMEFVHRMRAARESAELNLAEVRNQATKSWFERETNAVKLRYDKEIKEAQKTAEQTAALARANPANEELKAAAAEAARVVKLLTETQKQETDRLETRRAEQEAETKRRLDDELAVLRARTSLEGQALVSRLRALALERDLREANERAIAAGRKKADDAEIGRIREKHALEAELEKAVKEAAIRSPFETAVGSGAARVMAMLGGGRDTEQLRVLRESKDLLRQIRDKAGLPALT